MPHARLYGAMLKVLPRPFRERNGDEMKILFTEHLEGRSAVGRALAWGAAVWDVASLAVRLRLAGRPRRPQLTAVSLLIPARSLVRSRGFTVVTVLTLGIGIAAVTTIYAVLDRVVLRPLPYPDADRLVAIRSLVSGQGPDEVWGLSEAGYFHFAEQSRTLEVIGAVDDVWIDVQVTLAVPDGAVRIAADSVSASLLDVLAARAAHGRLLDQADDQPGAPLVVMLSHEVWAAHFGADPSVVGRTIRVDGAPREIVGILEAGFRIPGRGPGVLVPFRLDADRPPINDHWVGAFARLRPEATLEQARAELAGLTARFPEIFPDAYDEEFMEEWGFQTRVESLRDHVIGNVAGVLWTLLGGVALVLLIAVANVANLFILRAEAQRGDLAIRRAHGASRWQLAAEGLVEGVIIAGIAAGGGVLAAAVALDVLVLTTPAAIPRLSEIGLGWGSFALAIAIAALVAFVVGPLPRMWMRIDVVALGEAGRGQTTSGGRQLLRRCLVGGQVALAVTLLTAAGLMLRSMNRLLSQDVGFTPEHVLAVQVPLPAVRYDDFATSARFYQELTERIEALPGVLAAGGSTHLPFGIGDGCWATYSDARPARPGEPPICVQAWAVSPGYLEALGVPVEGRVAGWSDAARGSPDVVVTRALANRFWPGQDPMGKTIRGHSWGDAPRYRVAGVAGDLRADGVDRGPLEAVFLPIQPLPGTPLHWGPFWGGERELHVVVRSSTDRPQTYAPSIRAIIAELDPGVAPGPFNVMSTLLARSESVARTSLVVLVLDLAAGIALFMSAVGLSGVVSYFVRRRTREIGLRIALGADTRAVARAVLRQALTVALVGAAVGVLGAFGATRLLRSLLFEVHPNDPLALFGAVLVLVVVASVAAWLPARRATRIDPVLALRQE